MVCPHCHAETDSAGDACFKCGRSLTLLTEGSVLASRYEIQAVLGQGGMGIVYKAYDRELDETVAIKLLRSEDEPAPEVLQRFRREIKLARRVTHKNVCRINEFGVDDRLRFIAMEFVDGVDLRHVIRASGALPTPRGIEIGAQIAEGLQAIHDVGIVHRDLKTANVMLDAAGAVRLMDFGIAKQIGGDSTGATRTGQVIGTPEYMSPEQARGEAVDARSDIYSLGVVLFEILTGRVPFQGDTPVAVMLKHLQEPPPLEIDEAARLPTGVTAVLKRALEKSPSERFMTARELGDELRRANVAGRQDAIPTDVHGAMVAIPATQIVASPPVTAGAPLPQAIGRQRHVPTAPSARRARARSGAHRINRRRIALLAALGVAVVWATVSLLSAVRNGPKDESGRATSQQVVAGQALPTSAPLAAVPAVTAPSEPKPLPLDHVRVFSAGKAPADLSDGLERRRAVEAFPKLPLVSEAPLAQPSPEPRTETQSRPTLPFAQTVQVEASPPPEAPPGTLKLNVAPWADVEINGRKVGQTPFEPMRLSAGTYSVRFSHPDYHPLSRQIVVKAGETTKVDVDFGWEGFRRKEVR